MPNGNAVIHFVDRHPDEGRAGAAAFVDPCRTLTYGGLRDATSRFAAGLAAAGIGRERRMALIMLDTVEFPVAFWGALRAGVVPVPINTLLPAEQIAYHAGRQPGRARWWSPRRCCPRCVPRSPRSTPCA